ncbi:MAG: hypothetical protein AB1916_07500 [Thermodesulfobacteriota bacterium]
MTDSLCSLHCGRLAGVDPAAVAAALPGLQTAFTHVDYSPERRTLDLTGAHGLPDDPEALTRLLDSLSRLLGEDGRGSIILRCENTEICYFRRNMWALLAMHIPPDPFDRIRHAG